MKTLEADPEAMWIAKGLKHVVPRIPTKTDTEKMLANDYEDDDLEDDESGTGGMNIAVSSSDLTANSQNEKACAPCPAYTIGTKLFTADESAQIGIFDTLKTRKFEFSYLQCSLDHSGSA